MGDVMTMPYRMNGPKEIESKKLLLWPNNPRLKISDFKEVKYTNKQLLESSNQRNIFKLLSRYEDHDVVTLVKSMCKAGFMRQKAPIVAKIKGVDRYLVLEGNRRLTAIKTILADESLTISPANRISLEKIPCWIFEHTSKEVPLKAAISRLVAEEHIKGQKPHTKLQRAHMLYDAYEGFLSEAGKGRKFVVDEAVLASTAEFFDFPQRELEGEISVVRLYKQFVEAYELEDIPKKCSERLSWVHKNQKHFKAHFGYDAKHLSMEDEGLDCFYDVFLHPEAAVYNPQTFRKFLNVMRYGGPEDIAKIRDGSDALSDVERRIRQQRSGARFLLGLEGVEKRLNGLRVSDFNRTIDETSAIKRIVTLVDNKLRRLSPELTSTSSGEGIKSGRFKKPTNIQEAMSLEYSQLTKQVAKVVRSRPNASCVREKVPTYLLKEWGVKSRGRPREAFCDHVDRTLTTMAEEGALILYRARNERVRL
jgi:hypothetical protein